MARSGKALVCYESCSTACVLNYHNNNHNAKLKKRRRRWSKNRELSSHMMSLILNADAAGGRARNSCHLQMAVMTTMWLDWDNNCVWFGMRAAELAEHGAWSMEQHHKQYNQQDVSTSSAHGGGTSSSSSQKSKSFRSCSL